MSAPLETQASSTTLRSREAGGPVMSYPERIPKARLEATLLNRELDDTLFDARLRQSARPSTVADPMAWLGGGSRQRTVDGLLAPAKKKEVKMTLKPIIKEGTEGGHGACYTVTLPVGCTRMVPTS